MMKPVAIGDLVVGLVPAMDPVGAAWRVAAGADIALRTRVTLRKGVLKVVAEDSALAQRIFLARPSLLEGLHRHPATALVTAIEVRTGSVGGGGRGRVGGTARRGGREAPPSPAPVRTPPSRLPARPAAPPPFEVEVVADSLVAHIADPELRVAVRGVVVAALQRTGEEGREGGPSTLTGTPPPPMIHPRSRSDPSGFPPAAPGEPTCR